MNLNRIFKPKTIALIGASPKPRSVGSGILSNLKHSKAKVYCINPNYEKISGYTCYSSILDIKENIDLAIIAVRSGIVKDIAKQCKKRKVGGVVLISAGFAEIGKEGKELQNEIKEILKDIPLIGPNCLGILNPKEKLNASFAPVSPDPGNIAFVSQSGALIDSVLDLSITENFGFSKVISLGNMADLGLVDFIEYLAKDKDTKVITLYIEGIKDGRRFLKVAKDCKKPIIAIKAGKSTLSKQAVSTHTGSLAGDYEIFKTAFKQADIIETNSVIEMFDIAKAISWQASIKNNIAILTNGGGVGILSVDYCDKYGVKLAKLKDSTIKNISKDMHPAWSKRNPVDILGDANSKRYEVALDNLLKQSDIHGVLVLQTLQNTTEPILNAKIISELNKKYKNKAIVCSFVGGKLTQDSVDVLEKNHIPNYTDPKRAVKAIKSLIKICKKKSIFFG